MQNLGNSLRLYSQVNLIRTIILSNNTDPAKYSSDFYTYNIALINELISEIILFYETGNKFKSHRVKRLFNALYKIAKRLNYIEENTFKYIDIEHLEGSYKFYCDFKDDLVLFKIRFKSFYKSIFNYT